MNVLRITARVAAAEAKTWLSKFLPFVGKRHSRDQWELEYARGEWERLREIDELPHYGAISVYVSHYAGLGSVLDVGCGEGILQEVLGRSRYRRYLGIDLAKDAILKASTKQDAATSFECSDAASYAPRESFDTIVFNEVLYYFDAPLDLMARYAPHLSDGGTTIVSMVVDRRSLRIWKTLDRLRKPEAEVLVANRTAGWVVKVYRGGFPQRTR